MENVKSGAKAAALGNPMGTAPILPLIVKMSLPAMFSMLIQALYNIVDSMYVSELSETALSSVTLVFPVQMLIVAVSVGTGVGISSCVSRRLGEKRIDAAQNVVCHGMLLSNLEYLLFLLFGLFGAAPFCIAFGKGDELLISGAIAYSTIVTTGSIFVFNAIPGERIMQSCGNMIFPMFCQLSGAITNIILDPIMIFGRYGCPAFGISGAAYATIIGQFVSMVASYTFLYVGKFPVKVNFKGFKWHSQTVKDIYSVALPTMIMQAISSVTNMILNAILMGFSSTAMAVLGAYFKVQSFVFMPLLGMTQGVMPILGYNFGAKNKKRILNTFKDAMIIGVSIMVVGCIVFQLIPERLIGLFNPSEEMLSLGMSAFKIISLCFPFAAMSIIPSTTFQATGHGINSMIISLLRQVVFIMPFAYLLSRQFGVKGVWMSYPVAEAASLVASTIMLIKLYKKEIQPMPDIE